MDALQSLVSLVDGRDVHISVDLASAPDGLRRITGGNVGDAGLGARCLFEDARTTDAHAVSPWLLKVPNAKRTTWLSRSVSVAVDCPAVLWLIGGPPTQELFDRMTRRLDVTLSDGTDMLLRYFDPRILHELHCHLDAKAHASFFGVCDQWCYLNRDAELCEISAQPVPPVDSLSSPLVLSTDTEQALLVATEAGQVLVETLKRWPADLQRMRRQDQFELAKACCTEAQAMGLDNLADEVLLLMYLAGHPEGYLRSQDWAAVKRKLLAKQVTLPSLLESGD